MSAADEGLLCPVCSHEAKAAAACSSCGADLSPQRAALQLQEGALREAQREMMAGRYRGALSALSRASALGPRGARFRLLKGLALFGAGRVTAAEALLTGSATWERLRPAAQCLFEAERRYRAGRELAFGGDLSGARAALSDGPVGGDGLLLLGLCALYQDDREAAQAAFRAALAADPSNAHAASWLAL
jgi:tetratricopeptide (TPR) repeat protein